jgi:hypothetical protein
MAINYYIKNKAFEAKKPVEMPEKQNLEDECVEELNELSQKLKAESNMKKDNIDANYFGVLVFNNASQYDEFLNKLGVRLADKQYIDGKAFAKKIGITIETPDKPAPKKFNSGSRFAELV